MKTIKLTQQEYAKVDDQDYEWLSQYTWCYSDGYAETKSNGTKQFMHRMVVAKTAYGDENTKLPFLVEHDDQDKLNNQRANLLKSNKVRNALNRPARGVSITWNGKYRAQLRVRGVTLLDKVFSSELEASAAYETKKHQVLQTL